MPTEGLADGSDNADFATAICEHPAFRRRRRVLGRGRPQIKTRLQTAEDFTPGNDHFFEPGPGGIQWHEFDESKTQVVSAGELSQRFDFMVVNTADNDRVYFDGMKSQFLSQPDRIQEFDQAITTGDFFEIRPIERIQAEAN